MKAVVYTKYGGPEVLQLQEREKPVPNENQVLVKVLAVSINALDSRRFDSVSTVGRLMDALLFKSVGKVLGADIAGRIEAIGANVSQFQVGDEVFGFASGSQAGLAEYACSGQKSIVHKPANISFAEAAAVPVAALSALQALRDKGNVQAGQKVLIYGASGGVGTYAVQLAKVFGAEVTAVCSTRNVEMVRQLGADHVIDYKKEAFKPDAQQYDLILAINGYQPLQNYLRALTPNGNCVVVGGSFTQIIQTLLMARFLSRGTKKLGFMGLAKASKEDLLFMKELLEAGKVKSIIDKTFPLSETAAAFRYIADEHARGKVVITI
jgi:NADPH:quinone reductase-like Zn-dependent oxidoreductase